MSVRRVAPGESGAVWLAALATFDPASARVLKSDASVAVSRATLQDRDVVIKAWDRTTPWARVRSRLGLSPAWAHWRGAAWLQAHGIATARVLALIHERPGPGELVEWMIMDALPGRSLIQILAELHADPRAMPARRQHELARALGRQLAALDKAGRFNRDHKPSNLIVAWPEEIPSGHDWPNRASDQPIIGIIDCVGLRQSGRERWRGVRRMLASLIIEPTGCGLYIRKTLRLRVLASFLEGQGPMPREARRAALRGGWASVERLVAAHGDPTPRVSPLGSPSSAPPGSA